MILITHLSRDNFVWPSQYLVSQETMDSLSSKLKELFSEAEEVKDKDDNMLVFLEDEYEDEDSLDAEIDEKLAPFSLSLTLSQGQPVLITKAYIILAS